MRKMAVMLILLLSSSSATRLQGSPDDPPAAPEAHDQKDEPTSPFRDPGGMYGEYASSQESSGTTWQPSSTPRRAVPLRWGEWVLWFQGFVNGGWIDDPEPRGDESGWTTNMFFLRALRPTFEGTLGLRAEMSLEPTMGKDGYPLLLQTGQTDDGTNPLFDRQHPHDLFTELALTFTAPITDSHSAYFYFAPVGQPALGPPSFRHRFSAVFNPVAPITQSWLDSTRVTYGVLTLGFVSTDNVKLEGSFFRGREPDEDRWGIEAPAFDSYSLRATVNPNENWSLQASFADLTDRLQIRPFVDMTMFTASATYNRNREQGNWQSTLGFARRKRDTSDGQNAFLAESALDITAEHTLFGRFEWAEKDGLFATDDPLTNAVFDVGKLAFGYLYHLPIPGRVGIGVGASGSVHFLPEELDGVYDGERPTSFLVFARVDLE